MDPTPEEKPEPNAEPNAAPEPAATNSQLAAINGISKDGRHFFINLGTEQKRIDRATPMGVALAGLQNAANEEYWKLALDKGGLAGIPVPSDSENVVEDPPKRSLLARLFGRKQAPLPPLLKTKSTTFIPAVPDYAGTSEALGIDPLAGVTAVTVSKEGASVTMTDGKVVVAEPKSKLARSVAVLLEECDALGHDFPEARAVVNKPLNRPIVSMKRYGETNLPSTNAGPKTAKNMSSGKAVGDLFYPNSLVEARNLKEYDTGPSSTVQKTGMTEADRINADMLAAAAAANGTEEPDCDGLFNRDDEIGPISSSAPASVPPPKVEKPAPAKIPAPPVAKPSPLPAATQPVPTEPEKATATPVEVSNTVADNAPAETSSQPPPPPPQSSNPPSEVESGASEGAFDDVSNDDAGRLEDVSVPPSDPARDSATPALVETKTGGPKESVHWSHQSVRIGAGDTPLPGGGFAVEAMSQEKKDGKYQSLAKFNVSKADHEVIQWLAKNNREAIYKVSVKEQTPDDIAKGELPEAQVESVKIKNETTFAPVDWKTCRKEFELANKIVQMPEQRQAMKSAIIESAVSTPLLPSTSKVEPPKLDDVKPGFLPLPKLRTLSVPVAKTDGPTHGKL